MRQPDDIAAHILALRQQLIPRPGQPPLRASAVDRLAERIETLLWVLEMETLAEAPETGALPDGAVPDETPPADREDLSQPSRFDTLVTAPQVRTFGQPDVVCLSLPPLLRPPFVRPSQAIFLSRDQWHRVQALTLPDPWAAADPAASARLAVRSRA